MANIRDVQHIIKKMESFRYKHGMLSAFQDALAMWTFALSNKFDYPARDRRERQYLEIAKKYNGAELEQFADIFADVMSLLTRCHTDGFDDYLGCVYMNMDLGNKGSGQFFTPYHLSKLMAKMLFNPDTLPAEGVVTMNEPTCGAGGMIMALADTLWNDHKFNYSDRLLVIAQDIDIKCVYMTYLQTALAGIPAVIYHGDTMAMKFWDVFYTPAYLFQWPKFKEALKAKQAGKQVHIEHEPNGLTIKDGFMFYYDGPLEGVI